MADLNKPESSSEALQATASVNLNGTVKTVPLPPGHLDAHPTEAPPTPWYASEIVMLVRWFTGMVAVQAFCGWGLFALVSLVLYKFGYSSTHGEMALEGIILGVISLCIFFAVERKHLLSRYMGLRLFQHDPVGVKSALYLWFTGMPGLLLRSTTVNEASAETDTASSPSGQADTPPQTDGVREIIETVVFVVVLVLLLKSFAAEAFVIPTGSMAETLYGYQRMVTCPECGVEFPVNCSSEVDPQPGQEPTHITGCTCPSCRYHIDFAKEEAANPNWKKPDWNSGDRVLVAKFLYELFNKRPNRLDVVVFKYPGDSHNGNLFPRTGPIKNQTPMNYIKRLIGLPGETIAIHRGKLYVLPPGSGVQFPDWEAAQHDEELRTTLWEWRYMHVDDNPEAHRLFEQEKFTIIRKPPETIMKVRRLIYDNDHQAKDLKGVLPPRWAGDNWKEDGTGFKIDGGEGLQWLRYRHYLRDNPNTPHLRQPSKTNDALTGKIPARSLIADVLGYNSYEPHNVSPGENWVGDLMIDCEVVVDKAQGEVVLELSKSHNRFQLVWDLATGDMELKRLDDLKKNEQPESLAKKKALQPKQGSTYRLRFANFDDRLVVWLNDALPFDDGVTYQGSKEQYAGPVAKNDLEPASIAAKGASLTLRKLSLWRDIYYTAGDSPTSADASGNVDLTDPGSWSSLESGMPTKTLYVQPDHFLCLGDNSPESSDGRSWGLVPERLLLGRAMLVYYPFGRAGRIR